MTAAGVSSFAAVTVDGGDTYWHERANGDDPLGMIIHEVLPRLASAGLATARIGISGDPWAVTAPCCLASGWLREPARPGQGTAARPQPAAVAALSPAIFASYADAIAANRTSFDSQA